MPRVLSNETHTVDPVNAAFWATPCSRDPYKFIELSAVDDRELWLTDLLWLDPEELCSALRSKEHYVEQALADPQVCTLLLYRIANATDDAVAAQTLINKGADPRGGVNGVSALLYRKYCWRILLNEQCREAVRAKRRTFPFSFQKDEPWNKHQTASVKTVAMSLDNQDTCVWHVLERHFKGQKQKTLSLAVMCEPLLEPIHLAAGAGKEGVVRVLTAAGASPVAQAWWDRKQLYLDNPKAEQPEPRYDTPLSRAAKLWASGTVRFLTEHLLTHQPQYFTSINGRTLAVLLRSTAADPELFDKVVTAVLPEDSASHLLSPCGDAQQEMDINVRQVLVYEKRTFMPFRWLLLLLQVAGNEVQRIRTLLSHVLGLPDAPKKHSNDSNPTILLLCCLNFALCQEDPILLEVLLKEWHADPNTVDLTNVALIHAAVRAECPFAVVNALLQAGADPNTTSSTDVVLYEGDDISGCDQNVWEQRVWLTMSNAMDVLVYVTRRAVTADIHHDCAEFCLSVDGHIPTRALNLLRTAELLLSAGAVVLKDSLTVTVNDLYAILMKKRNQLVSAASELSAADRPEAAARLPQWVPAGVAERVESSPMLTMWVERLLGVDSEPLARHLEEKQRLQTEVMRYGNMARFLQLLVLVADGMSWTPALHTLYPSSFNGAVRQLLLMWNVSTCIAYPQPACRKPGELAQPVLSHPSCRSSVWDTNSSNTPTSASDVELSTHACFDTEQSPFAALAMPDIPSATVDNAQCENHLAKSQDDEQQSRHRGEEAEDVGEQCSMSGMEDVDLAHTEEGAALGSAEKGRSAGGIVMDVAHVTAPAVSVKETVLRGSVLPPEAVRLIIQHMASPVSAWLVAS